MKQTEQKEDEIKQMKDDVNEIKETLKKQPKVKQILFMVIILKL